ncbi:MAG: hypothetical protein NVSMB3_00140 [Acidobacteriaceae bacterium]
MRHIAEEDLIAYQMGEGGGEESVRAHLEACAECAQMSESIAETLRVFSAEPAPHADLEQAWQRMRVGLPALTPKASGWAGLRGRWMWPAAGMAMAALLVILFAGVRMQRGFEHRRGELAVQRRGPLTERPTDPAIANHLDSAERLLTEVNHASGPLDPATRGQAHDLLLQNAVYVHKAHDAGDLAEASVLENLGRVLTTLDHESSAASGGWHIRFEMNTDGLLLDIRILRQNDGRQ